MKKIKILLMINIFLLSAFAHAGLLYNYHQLAVKDLDQMNEIVTQKLNESKKSREGKHVPLKEALQAIYSRPNEDGMVDKVVAQIRSALEEQNMYEKVLGQLTDEAMSALKHPKNFKPNIQVTYAIFLENLLSELKPKAKEEGFPRQLIMKIQKAEIEISKEARNELQVRMMKSLVSPSEIAAKLLEPEAPKNPETK